MLEKIVEKKKELDKKELKKVAGGDGFSEGYCEMCNTIITLGETYCRKCKKELGLE